jgi:hypothetical protein
MSATQALAAAKDAGIRVLPNIGSGLIEADELPDDVVALLRAHKAEIATLLNPSIKEPVAHGAHWHSESIHLTAGEARIHLSRLASAESPSKADGYIS